MRQVGLALLVVTLTGCESLHDAFSAHPVVVATAAGQTLTVERLADLVGPAQKLPLRPDALASVADLYVNYTLFAAALAKGKDLDDSLLVLAANWPLVSQLKWERFHDRLLAAHTRMAAATVDSAYQAGTIRLFQHILLQVPQSAAPPVAEKRKAEIETILREANGKSGGAFARLAQRYSEDPGSKAAGGYLAPVTRGQFVPAFESTAWQLAPGAMSGVVRSPFGFHIIRRPPLSEVRDSFRVGLENAITQHLDSVYLDSLSQQRQLDVDANGPAIARQTVTDIAGAGTSDRELVRYRGGSFRVKELVRWLLVLPANDVRGIPMASDAQLRQFLKVLAQRALLLEQVDSAGVQLTPDDWKQVRQQHDSTLKTIASLLGVSRELFKDSATTPVARLQLAARHVDDYLERVVQRRAQFYAIPPFLAERLRADEPWSVNEAGVVRALDRARVVRAAVDSLHPPAATGQGGLRPAPGPPPIDTTPHRVLR